MNRNPRSPAPLSPRPPTPTNPQTRLEILDILRGFALLGILFMNMNGFSGAFEVAWSGLDRVAMQLIRFLIEAKFYSLFSFLFGLGMAMQMLRAEAQGTNFVALYLRRLFFLLLIGLMHAFFLWEGDILVFYALFGLPLLFFRRRSNKTILVAAGVCLLISIILSTPGPAATFRAAHAAALADIRRAAFQGRAIYASGTYWEITIQHFREVTAGYLNVIFTLWIIFAMFLLGMYAGRRRIFEDIPAHLPFIRKVMVWALVLGGFFNLLYLLFSDQAQFTTVAGLIPAELEALSRRGARAIAAPALSIFYVTAIIFLHRVETWRRRLAPLAPVGRMALSNYLLQSLVATTIFYGYGLGLYGQFGPATALVLTVIILAVQVPLSAWWLERYQFGPAEWLWRSLTYGRWQPMRIGPDREGIVPSKRSVIFTALGIVLLLGFGLWRSWQSLPKVEQLEFVGNLPGVATAPTATPRPPLIRARPRPYIVATPVVEPVSRVPGPSARHRNLWTLALAFDEELAFAEIETLAGQPYSGRQAGSPQGRAAGDYIAGRFAEYGLRPAGNDETYFQSFPLAYTFLGDTPRLVVTPPEGRAHSYRFRHDFSTIVTRYMGEGEGEGPVIWANDCAHDDFDDVDVVGKVVFCRDQRWISRQDDVGRLALEHGAAGLLLLGDTEARPIDRIGSNRETWVPEPIPTFRISPKVAQDLLEGTGMTLDDLTIAFSSFPLPATAHLEISLDIDETAQGRNVLGVLPGRDPQYAAEVVILGGHYDHMGQDPDGTAWPGANDNASGIAILLEIARAWQAQGYVPRRTVLFAAWDAEEMGLLGSYHYVNRPRYPLTQTVGMLQLDMVGAGEETLYIDGDGPLVPRLNAIAHTMGITTVNSNSGRSDHAPFLEAGVPANLLIWFGGQNSEATAHYHRPLDTPAVIEPDKLLATGQIVGLTTLALVEGEPAIQDLIRTRSMALRKGDLEAFLATGAPARRQLDRAWFANLQALNPADFNMEATDLLLVGRVATATVRLSAAYRQGDDTKTRSATLPVRFIHQGDGWRWDGPALLSTAPEGSVALMHPAGQEREAVGLGRLIAARYAAMAEKLGLLPEFGETGATFILYPDSQSLRADTNLALPSDIKALVAAGDATHNNSPTVKLVYTPQLARSHHLTGTLVQLVLAEAGVEEVAAPWLWHGLPLAFPAEAGPIAAQAEYLPVLYETLLSESDEPLSVSDYGVLSWAAVEFIRQEAGWEGIGRLILALGEGSSLDTALSGVIGSGVDEFDGLWRSAWRSRLSRAREGLTSLLEARQGAVLSGDEAAFMETVDATDPTLVVEQQHWFADLGPSPVEAFLLTGRPLAFLEDGGLLAAVKVTYRLAGDGQATSFSTPVHLRPANSGYRWAGVPLDELRGEHFIIRYPADRAQLAQDLLAEAEAVYAQVTADLGVGTSQPLTIKLYNDAEAFRTSIFLSMPDWAGGWTEPGESIKRLLRPQTTLADHRRAVAHELTHQLLFQLGVRSDWLHEGLATYESGRLNRADAAQVTNRRQPALLRAVEKKQLFTLAGLPPFHLLSAQEAPIAYAQSWDMVRYLIETQGLAKLQDFLRSLGGGESLERAFRTTFGLTQPDFEAAWRESVERGHAAPEWVGLVQTFDPVAVEAHIAELTGPGYAGRRAGSTGEEAAARYIAGQFAAYGLSPMGPEGTFGQRFSISRPVLLAAPRLLAFDSNGSSDGSSGEPKDALGYRRDFLLVQEGAAGPGEVEADLVWVRGEEYGAVRLAGQIVLRRPTGDLPGEIAQAISHGAAGLILAGNRAEKALVAKEPLTARPALAPEETIPVVEVTEDGLQRLLAAGDYSLRDLNEAPPAMPLDLRVRLEVPISLERTNSTNVLGFLPGADPDLRQEVVIIGAGYDYAGDDPDDEVCLSGGACLDLPGFKYPGANDASGVGVLLEVARLWQESGYRPSRSVLFAAWGAETLGQAGSRFYAAHPAVPLTQTVALVELDAIGGGSGYYLQAQGDPNREAVLRFSIAAAARQIEGRLDLVKSSRSGAQETFRAVGVPAMLVYWKGAAQKSLPADLADKIDSYRLGVTGRAVALTLMMLAR